MLVCTHEPNEWCLSVHINQKSIACFIHINCRNEACVLAKQPWQGVFACFLHFNAIKPMMSVSQITETTDQPYKVVMTLEIEIGDKKGFVHLPNKVWRQYTGVIIQLEVHYTQKSEWKGFKICRDSSVVGLKLSFVCISFSIWMCCVLLALNI